MVNIGKNRLSVVISASSLMICLIHHLPAPIIHCLVFQLKPVTFLNGQTVGYRKTGSLTLPSVNLEENPNAFADIAPASCFDLASITVFEKSLHLGTVG
jgi:hypothetical protein